MGDRGVTVLATVLGLLGGMGGAAVGGYVPNQGQPDRFEHERATEARARLAETYVQFVRAAETEFSAGPSTDDQLLHTAEAEVALATTRDDLRRTAESLTLWAFDGENVAEYRQVSDEFIRQACT